MTVRDLATLRDLFAAQPDVAEAQLAETCAAIATDAGSHAWIATVPAEAAREALARARRRLGAGETLPLFGIPFAVKDNIDVAGMPTTAGCPAFAYVPPRSATVVERLERAGAVLVGKTNLDQFATGLSGTRSPYGIPASPFDPDYISGGSSSGSAVAVARGLVAFALGTDTAGSGRVPAAFGNIVGLKPTRGLVSTRGVVPACRSLDCVSIFAPTAGDALAVLDIVAGFDREDAYSRTAPAAASAPQEWPGAVRIGVPRQREFFGDAAAAALFDAAAARIEAIGGAIVEIDFSPFAAAAALLYEGPWIAERFAALGAFIAAHPGAVHPVVREIICGTKGRSAVEAFQGLYRLAELCRAAEAEWARMDALLVPTAPTTYTIAAMQDDPVMLNSRLGIYTNFANLMDLAAVAVPAGFRADGLPFGVSLVGPAFSDGRLALLADRLHRALPDARVGATGEPLPDNAIEPISESGIDVAVVGAHLAGQPLNRQLTERGARLVATRRTASGYRLFALPGTTPPKPGLIFDGTGAGGIEVEVWRMPAAAFGSFVAEIPSPLAIGTLKLDDGSAVKGFLCEPHALDGAREITAHGGWRAYLAAAAKISGGREPVPTK